MVNNKPTDIDVIATIQEYEFKQMFDLINLYYPELLNNLSLNDFKNNFLHYIDIGLFYLIDNKTKIWFRYNFSGNKTKIYLGEFVYNLKKHSFLNDRQYQSLRKRYNVYYQFGRTVCSVLINTFSIYEKEYQQNRYSNFKGV